MFALSRGRKSAITGAKSLLNALELTGGIPKDFWQSSYALGFLTGDAIGHASLSNGGPLSQSDSGYIVMEKLCAVAPSGRGMEIAKRAATLAKAEDADFKNGSRNAIKIVAYGAGMAGYEQDADVISAENAAKLLVSLDPLATDRARATGHLLNRLFFQIVLPE